MTWWIAATLGIAVAVPLTIGVLSSSTGCGAGGVVTTLSDAQTPFLIVDTPYHGYAEGKYIVQNGYGTHSTKFDVGENGSVYGWFELENWTIYSVNPPGLGQSCSAHFLASGLDQGRNDIGSVPPDFPIQYTNDSQAPTSIGMNGTSNPVTYFDAGFHSQMFTVSTCGTSPVNESMETSHISIGLGFNSGGGWQIVWETLTIDAEYYYQFPANAGTWAVDNLSAPGGPGGGWSFSYLGGC